MLLNDKVWLCGSYFSTSSENYDHQRYHEDQHRDADQNPGSVGLDGPDEIRMGLNVCAHAAEQSLNSRRFPLLHLKFHAHNRGDLFLVGTGVVNAFG